MSPNTTEHQTARKGIFKGLQGRLIAVILLAFVFPYLCMIALVVIVNSKLGSITATTETTHSQTNEALSEAIATTKVLFKLSAIRKAETLASNASLIISMRNLIESELPSDRYLLEMVQTERIGEECEISIINPLLDKVIVDKYLEPGADLNENLPNVSQLMSERRYLKILSDLRTNPSLEGSIGTISEVYQVSPDLEKVKDAEAARRAEDETAASPGGEKAARQVFVIVTPIQNTPYSLSVVARMGGLTQAIQDQVGGSLNRINETLLEIDKKSQQVNRVSTITAILGAVFGMVFVFLLFRFTGKRIIQPFQELMQTADSIRRGEYDRRVKLFTMTDEFMELGQAMNRMLDTITELIESEEDKKRLQEHIIQLLDIVSRASEGDFTRRGEVTENVLGSVADAFNMMLDSISKLVMQAKDSGRRISTAATSILEAARKIALDAKRQGREIVQVNAVMQQASRSMQRVSISADMAKNESQRATVAAQKGADLMDESIQNMQRMRNNVQSTAKTIKSLGDRSLEINAIVEMINDISARTNILSLNAAIEASKAGKQGKGFAIVADEIRKLAERTTNATKEISQFIEDIQIETNDAVLAMEEVTRKVEQGWKQADQGGVMLKDIKQVVSSAAEKIMEISTVSNQMVAEIDKVVEAINSIFQVTRETTDGIFRTSSEASSLLKPIELLNDVIRTFRLKQSFEHDMGADWVIPAEDRPSDGEIERIIGQPDHEKPEAEVPAREDMAAGPDVPDGKES